MDTRTLPTTTGRADSNGRSWLARHGPALSVLLLAPVTAEYLAGYDSSTGNLGELLFGLLFFAPLYGAPALLIREAARRSGRGWPTMLLLALAFGIIQAGLVDHSLFNQSYRDIDYWQDFMMPTYIPALGFGAYPALEFIGGHMIWSISVPIMIGEALAPGRRNTPWLGTVGTALLLLLYILISVSIFQGHVQREQFLPSAAQLSGAAALALALAVAAFAVRARRTAAGSVPTAWTAGIVAFAALGLPILIELGIGMAGGEGAWMLGWPGVAIRSGLIGAAAALAWHWSGRAGWDDRHRLALAGGALLSRAGQAFLITPLGDVPLAAKLAHNSIGLLGALALLALAARSLDREAAMRETE